MNKEEFKELNEEEIKKILEEAQDPKLEKFKYNSKGYKKAKAKVKKNPDHILVQYLRQNYTISWKACKIVSGNIVVVDNKVHLVNPRLVWRDGKETVYIIREIDRLPVSNIDYDKLIKNGRITVNDAVVIKAILGAVQKQGMTEQAKKYIVWIVVIVVALIVAYIFFGKGLK
jgi:hypothetical protein